MSDQSGKDGQSRGGAARPRGADDRPGDDDGRRAEAKGADGAGEDDKPGGVSKALHNPLFLPIAIVVVVALIALALLWWLHARRFVSTDDAFVDTHIVHLAPQVAGQVQRVRVQDNSAVSAGELLVQIEPTPIRAQYDQAQASRAQADAQLEQAGAQVRIDQAKLEQARADLHGVQAQAVKAARDLERYQTLRRLNAAAVSQAQIDQVSAQATSAAAQRDSAQRQVKAAGAQLASSRTQVSAAAARLQSAQAQLRQTGVNLSDTQIIAPVAGTIAQKTVAAGDYVQPGQQLMAIVPQLVWITANFKETQLALIRPGQPAVIKVDGCRGEKLDGRVDSIQRGAGQAFALLPAENATGNFVKVVQRVPVKITLRRVPRDCLIGPGMSVQPTVQVR